MANKKVSGLAQITSGELQSSDLLLLADISANESKKLTLQDISSYLLSSGNITGSFYGTASYALSAKSASYSPSMASASYAASASWALNCITASNTLIAEVSDFSVQSAYSISSSYAVSTSYQSAVSSAFAETARTSSFLRYTAGTNNGTASNAITSSYALSASNALTANSVISASNALTASHLLYRGIINGTSSYSITSGQSNTSSFSLTSSFATTALNSITVNLQSSASWASQSLSSSYSAYALNSKNAATASIALPNPYLITYGIFSAITQSITSSQIDVISITSDYDTTASVDVAGTIIVPWTASVATSESIILNLLNRTTGVNYVLDMCPVYFFMGNTVADKSGSLKLPFTLMGHNVVSEDDYMLYITASSNIIKLDSTRNVKFGINVNVGSFTVSSGNPLQLYTDYPDYITFISTDGGPFIDTAAHIVTTGSNKMLSLNLSSVTAGIHNLWTLTNSTTISSSNNAALTSIGGLPTSLITASFVSGSLTAFESLSDTALTRFVCSKNLVTELPSFPNTTKYIDCSQNIISSISTLPSSLIEVYCDYTSISSPPFTLPSSIVSMSFSSNTNLSGSWLATLPSSLVYFWCRGNSSLTSLPTIPPSVIYLDVSNNYLTSLCQDTICADLVTNGLSSGYLDIRGNQSILPATLTRISTLLSRSWTVQYV